MPIASRLGGKCRHWRGGRGSLISPMARRWGCGWRVISGLWGSWMRVLVTSCMGRMGARCEVMGELDAGDFSPTPRPLISPASQHELAVLRDSEFYIEAGIHRPRCCRGDGLRIG